MPVVNWLSQTYEAISPNVSSNLAQNYYPENTEGEGKAPLIYIGTPGTETFTTNAVPDVTISNIQGLGSSPNQITVTTLTNHSLVTGQAVTIAGTLNYNVIDATVSAVTSPTTFIYFTTSTTSIVAETTGVVQSTGKSPIAGVGTTAGCRGLYTTSTGRLFGCFQDQVFEFFEDGSNVSRFPVSFISTRVSFTDDGVSLVFVDGFVMKVLNMGTNIVVTVDTFAQAGFQNPAKVVFLNQRVVIINNDIQNENNNKFFWTEIRDATLIKPLSFATAESSADPIISVEVKDIEIWFFGPRSYEVWRTDINPDLPYRLVGGSGSQVGCGARDSTESIANMIFWLGSSTAGKDVVYMSQGYNPQRISTHAIEFFLNKNILNTSDAVGFSYQQAGHTFYVLNFLQANKTFVYDVIENKWHERATRDEFTNVNNRWAPLFASFAFSQVICGADEAPLLFTLDLERFIEWDGRPIVRTIQGPIYWSDYRILFHNEFQVDMETGVGLQLGLPDLPGSIQDSQGADPVGMLQYSDDGGHTYSSERWTSLGKVGQYKTRVRWRRMGRSRNRVYRFVISDPIKCVIIGARVLVTLGENP